MSQLQNIAIISTVLTYLVYGREDQAVCYIGRRGHCNSQNGSEKNIEQIKLKQIAIS
jgi:hypothetical protein